MEGAVDKGITIKQHQKRLFHRCIIAEWGGWEKEIYSPQLNPSTNLGSIPSKLRVAITSDFISLVAKNR